MNIQPNLQFASLSMMNVAPNLFDVYSVLQLYHLLGTSIPIEMHLQYFYLDFHQHDLQPHDIFEQFNLRKP